MLIDTHAHLDLLKPRNREALFIDRARKAGVGTIVTIGIDADSSSAAVALARQWPGVYATVGFHPHGAGRAVYSGLDRLKVLAASPKVVALGEMGLDYFRDRSPRKVQREVFRTQLGVAREVGLPVVIHDRDAHEDVYSILKDRAQDLKGIVMHCFSGDWAFAKRCLDLGCYLSIPGVVTYKKAGVLQNVVKRAPMERLLMETDCPFLTPTPFRGSQNEPAYVKHVAEKVAEIRDTSLEEVARQTTANARAVFGLED